MHLSAIPQLLLTFIDIQLHFCCQTYSKRLQITKIITIITVFAAIYLWSYDLKCCKFVAVLVFYTNNI